MQNNNKKKPLTRIQELELEKRKIHEENFKKKYPNGCFSLQTRHGKYGFGNKKEEATTVALRWGTKTNSTHYWEKSVTVGKDLIPKIINNSFGYVRNYDSLEKLLAKCKEMMNIKQEQIDIFIKAYNEQRNGKVKKLPIY